MFILVNGVDAKRQLKLLLIGNKKKKFFKFFFLVQILIKNKDSQMIKLKNFIKEHDNKKNIVFLTHYVVIKETLNYSPNSGEIIVIDKNYNILGNLITD